MTKAFRGATIRMRSASALWRAFDAIRHVRFGPDYQYVRDAVAETILNDVRTANCRHVVGDAGRRIHSDHPGNDSNEGPSWVAAVVNAIGNSPYWNSTAIC